MKITETIFDIVTQETTVIERELTADEIAERKTAAELQAAENAKAIADATAKADLLAKLGITAEEAALLLA